MPRRHRRQSVWWVCCVGGKQTKFSVVLPRSDGVGEFDEDCCELMPWVDVHAEFVVAASELLHERVSGTDYLRRKPFQATNRS